MQKIENIRLYTGEEAFDNGCVLIDGNRIAYAGDASGCPDMRAETIDGEGGIVMPGFHNAHCHAAMTLERGVGSDLQLMDWLHQIFPIEDKLTETEVYNGTKMAILEMLRRGIVSFADMYFFMGEVGRVCEETGIRVNLCRGCTSREGIDSTRELKANWHEKADGRIRVSMGLHGEYTTNPEIAGYASEMARKLDLSVHVHLSETRGETDGCIERHGMTPTAYFESLHLFDQPTIAAHCVYVTDEDMEILKARGVTAVHNPTSNLKLASGVAPVCRMLQKGVRVALGTDGPSSNNVLDMQAEMKLASILQKGTLGDPTALNAREAIHMATRAGALALGFTDSGLLKPGMKADLILLNDETLDICPDIAAELVYAAQGLDVRMTMIDGKILYRDGRFLTLDPRETMNNARASFQKLMA